MEQKRRTITTEKTRKRKNNSGKTLTIIGVILGLALVFFVSYKIAYGFISGGESKETPETAISSSTEEDIANMSREDLEESYLKLKKQLEEKEEEIEMLKERLEGDEPKETEAPKSTPEPSDDDDDDDEPQSTPKPTAPPAATPKPTQAPMQSEPPAATEAPEGGLMSPEDLANLTGSTH